MSYKSAEEILQHNYNDSHRVFKNIIQNMAYTIHPFGRGDLTTNGVQYSSITTGSTGITSKSTAAVGVTIANTTLSIPGFDNHYLDEIEFGLTQALASTNGTSTCGYCWYWKDPDESTWTALMSAYNFRTTKAWTDRTHSGYGKPATGYNKLPMALKLEAWGKTASMLEIKIKNSSYVKITPKRTA